MKASIAPQFLTDSDACCMSGVRQEIDQHRFFSRHSFKLHGTSDCRFTFGKNFARDLKSVFGSIEIWLAIGANMGRESFWPQIQREREILAARAVHVQIYVDCWRNFCPCESLKCSEESCLTWLLHLVGYNLHSQSVFRMRCGGNLTLVLIEHLKKNDLLHFSSSFVIKALCAQCLIKSTRCSFSS